MKISKIKVLALVLLLVGFSCHVLAQQEGQYTQYMFNRLTYNPAYAGSSGSICAQVMSRNSWMGLRLDAPSSGKEAGSAPVNYLFSFDMPIRALHGGIGAIVSMENVGYRQNISIDVDYAFRIYWGPGNLAAAVGVNLYNNTIDFSQLVGYDDLTGDGEASTSTDPALNSHEKTSAFLVDMSAGLYYQIPGKCYIGLGGKNLLATKSTTINYQNARTFYLMGGYEYAIPLNPSFKIKPSALVKTSNFSVFQGEISCLLDYQNTVWGGVSYRIQDAFAVLAGFNWKKLQIGLSYDFTTSKLGAFKAGRSKGTIEAYLRYCFKVIIPQRPPSVYRNTRYLL